MIKKSFITGSKFREFKKIPKDGTCYYLNVEKTKTDLFDLDFALRNCFNGEYSTYADLIDAVKIFYDTVNMEFVLVCTVGVEQYFWEKTIKYETSL